MDLTLGGRTMPAAAAAEAEAEADAGIGIGEAARLARLRALVVLDTTPEPVFDSIARMASEACGVPIALLSLIDAERQWFKANVGLPSVNGTARDVAFCAHAIAGDALLEVTDASQDPRFRDNPLVTGEPNIRFYAGAPLVLAGGARIGTLCVIDRAARRLTAGQAATLRSLAAIATQALEMRQSLIEKSLSVRSEYERFLLDSEGRHRALVETQAEFVSLAGADGTLLYANPAYARHFGRTTAEMVGADLFEFVEPADRDGVRALVRQVLFTGEGTTGENRMRGHDGSERWVAWTNRRQVGRGGEPTLHSVGRDITERKLAEVALRASQAFLARTGRVAGIGGWELDLVSGELTWSEQTRRIHDVGVDFVPTLDNAVAFYAPEGRSAIEAAVQAATEQGTPWDIELPFVSATGRHLWVRAQGEAEFESGRPVRLSGAFQDITERKRTEQTLRVLTQVFHSTTDFIVQADRHGNVTYMNPAVRKATGLADDAVLAGLNFAEFNTAATNRLFADTIVPAVRAGAVWLGETAVFLAGRREVPISHMVIAHRDPAGRIERYSSVMRDISAEVGARRELQRQTATLRAVIEAMPAIVAVVGADERYRLVNSAYERWFGASRERTVGRSLADVLGAADYARSKPWIERVLKGESVEFEKDYEGRHNRRHLRLSYLPLWVDGAVDGFVGTAHDVTPHKQEQVRLLRLAHRDALTGLLNRAGAEQFLEDRMAAGQGGSLAALYIDLDRFKPVNDRHGHPVGDEVLRLFGERLRRLVRPSDAVARLGGDEFTILLDQVREIGNARVVAAKVIEAARRPFVVGELRIEIGASVGVAFAADRQGGWADLVARADAMLYRAKEGGRGRQAAAGD